MHRVRLSEGRNQVESDTHIEMGEIQCRIDITVSPDGAIYFGSVDSEGGAIYRLIPE